MDMAHLRPEARDLALLPATERLARMPANRWISYTRASQAITLLGRMLETEPGRIRPGNLLIVGATNNGKTAIAERFLGVTTRSVQNCTLSRTENPPGGRGRPQVGLDTDANHSTLHRASHLAVSALS